MAAKEKRVIGTPFTSESARAAAKAHAGKRKRITLSVQEAWKAAFDKLQKDKDSNLVAWATANKQNLTDFYRLSTKLIPSKLIAEVENTVNVDLSGLSDEELKKIASLYDDAGKEG